MCAQKFYLQTQLFNLAYNASFLIHNFYSFFNYFSKCMISDAVNNRLYLHIPANSSLGLMKKRQSRYGRTLVYE